MNPSDAGRGAATGSDPGPGTGPGPDLYAHVQRLLRLLRDAGLPRTAADGASFLAALGLVDLERPAQVHAALYATCARSPEELPVLDALFRRWWKGETLWEPPPAERFQAVRPLEAADGLPLVGDGGEEGEGGGASVLAAVAQRDLRSLQGEQKAAVARLARTIAPRLAWAIARRLAPPAAQGRPDWRRTLRQAIRSGGELLRLVRRPPARTAGRLLLVLDISGSMAPYAETLLLLAHGLQSRLPNMETLLVATHATRVTQALTRAATAPAMASLTARSPGWGGGTRLAVGLAQVRERWPYLLAPVTRVVLLSDGLEGEDPAALGREMAEWRRRVERIVWFNPLLGDPEFTPEAGGIAAALPHVDTLVPGHSLAALARLPHYLTRSLPARAAPAAPAGDGVHPEAVS